MNNGVTSELDSFVSADARDMGLLGKDTSLSTPERVRGVKDGNAGICAGIWYCSSAALKSC